jgi:hypothetical protein
MPKTLVAVLVAALPAVASYAAAGTVNLECAYERALDVDNNSTSGATGHLSAHIQFTEDAVTEVIVSKGSRCDPRFGFVTDMEIGFACGLDLAGQRISYTFTLSRISGLLEQRFFFRGKLRQIHYGRCKITTVQ